MEELVILKGVCLSNGRDRAWLERYMLLENKTCGDLIEFSFVFRLGCQYNTNCHEVEFYFLVNPKIHQTKLRCTVLKALRTN